MIFRHVDHQNLSIILDSIDSARWGQIFSLRVLTTKIGHFKSKLCVTKVVEMKTLCAKVVVPGP